MIAERIPAIQDALDDAGLDGWLFAIFQHNDPVGLELLGLAGDHLITRRCYYLIPRSGEPRKLVHQLEPAILDHLPGGKRSYLSWRSHGEELAGLVEGASRLAAQYSPECALPTISRLDAGTADRLRSLGVELESAADLAQRFVATWTSEQMAAHHRASEHLHRIVLETFGRVSDALRGDREIDEHTVQRFIVERFADVGLVHEADPIVAVDAHAADPHYQPGPDGSAPIRPGNFLLIDLWAKEEAAGSVYADITWCGVCSPRPEPRHAEVFGIAVEARDAALDLVRRRFPRREIRGYEVDDAAREVIERAGYGDAFIHRTGHSIGITDHGQGANMDNLETHDTRLLLPMTGFSIEPGIYLPGDFGVRTEIDVVLTDEAVQVSGAEPQRELLTLL